MRRLVWIALACLIGLPGCSSEKHATRELSERERNEKIARSPLPARRYRRRSGRPPGPRGVH